MPIWSGFGRARMVCDGVWEQRPTRARLRSATHLGRRGMGRLPRPAANPSPACCDLCSVTTVGAGTDGCAVHGWLVVSETARVGRRVEVGGCDSCASLMLHNSRRAQSPGRSVESETPGGS